MGSTTTGLTTILGPGEGEQIALGEARVVLQACAPTMTVGRYTVPAGLPSPPLHTHDYDELYLVSEGRLTVQIRDERFELAPGASAFIEGHVPHTFANGGAEPVVFVSVCSPGGFDDYLRALAAGDAAAVAAASARIGFRAVRD
jgi:mannose-6-phosphate isomerase-like protein (cupin superfamily)